MTTPPPEGLLDALGQIENNLLRKVGSLAAKQTATLVGLVGGLFGMLLGYSIDLMNGPDHGQQPVGAILTILGIVTALLLWRGRRRIQIERRNETRRVHREALISEIGSVQKLLQAEKKAEHPSQRAIEALDRQYVRLVRELGRNGEALPPPSPPN
ncbi:MAG TPA: hypothetical protein VF662_01180 [Allosphingosinicella sp.]|jgi:hypothetical protein